MTIFVTLAIKSNELDAVAAMYGDVGAWFAVIFTLPDVFGALLTVKILEVVVSIVPAVLKFPVPTAYVMAPPTPVGKVVAPAYIRFDVPGTLVVPKVIALVGVPLIGVVAANARFVV